MKSTWWTIIFLRWLGGLGEERKKKKKIKKERKKKKEGLKEEMKKHDEGALDGGGDLDKKS